MEFVPQPAAPKGASAGSRPRVPVAFGQYEVGRTSKPWVKNARSAWSLDELAQSVPLEPQGDPGAYDPYAHGFLSDEVRRKGYSKGRKPFDSTEIRTLATLLMARDSPGMGKYDSLTALKKLYPRADDNASVFRSRSLQRPTSVSAVPGPGDYKPKHTSATCRKRHRFIGSCKSANTCTWWPVCIDCPGPGALPQ